MLGANCHSSIYDLNWPFQFSVHYVLQNQDNFRVPTAET